MAKRKQKRNYRRVVLGDVVEVPLSRGLAYAQYINDHKAPPVCGNLIRVLPGIFSSRPATFDKLVSQEERFVVFYPVGTAVARGLVAIAANVEIPERCREFPVFKGCNENYETGKKTWFLWDGAKEWKVGNLEPKHHDYPIHEVITHPILVDRIEQGWSPADEV